MTKKILTATVTLTLCLAVAAIAHSTAITVRGKLQRTVEPGGWLIVTESEKYLLLNAKKFQNEKWFVEGNEVTAVGQIKKGAITTQMEGTPFEAQSLQPAEVKASTMDQRTLIIERWANH